MRCNWCGNGEGSNHTKDKKIGKIFFYFCSDCVGDFEKELNPKRKLKKIRITELELLFCPKKNEVIQFDNKCVECEYFNGHYSATGYIECNYDGN